MKKTFVTINSQYPNNQQLFLQDPKSDLYILVKQKIYPLHKSFLSDVHFFQSPTFSQGKVHVIMEDIDVDWLQKILGYFYGRKFEFQRDWNICQLMKTLNLLGVTVLNKNIHADIKENFDQYGFFLLFQISQRFNLKWLRQMCDQQLTLMNFEQLNYNLYDLLQVQREVLQDILKLHEILKINRNIMGQSTKALKKIVTEYCISNQIDLSQVENILLRDQSTLDQIREEEYDDENIQKKNHICTQNQKSEQKTCKVIQNILSNLHTKTKQEHQKNIYEGSKKEACRVRVISYQENVEEKKQPNEIAIAMEVVLDNESKKNTRDIDAIDEGLKKFEKQCKEQDQKYLSLKKDIQRLAATKQSKSGEKHKSRRCSPSFQEQKTSKVTDTKQKQKTGILGDIPKLSEW